MSLKPLPKSPEKTPAMGIEPEARAQVAQALSRVLASTYALYQKSLFYHWNVTGEQFNSLHAMFETQYQELHMAGDEVAERIRALGHFAPGTLSEFAQLSSVPEDGELPKSARAMVENLLKSHEICTRQARAVLHIAQEADDEVTADMMIGRMRTHDKTAWMLRSVIAPQQ